MAFMPVRVIAFFLALVLLWSGFTAQEQAVSIAMTGAEQVDAKSPGEPAQRVPGGSVDDHRLDDLPAQSHVESLGDGQALLMDRVQAPAPGPTMARLRPYAAFTRLGPYLERPQRPPCATVLVA